MLRDAVKIASTINYFARLKANDLAVRIGDLDVSQRLLVVGIAKLWNEHRSVYREEVEVTGLEGVFRSPRKNALDRIDG